MPLLVSMIVLQMILKVGPFLMTVTSWILMPMHLSDAFACTDRCTTFTRGTPIPISGVKVSSFCDARSSGALFTGTFGTNLHFVDVQDTSEVA